MDLPPHASHELALARDRLILALDFPASDPALGFLASLAAESSDPPCWVKVGLELFLSEGPDIVRSLRRLGYSVFLDLKLHDIPNTVAAAVRALSALDVQLLTVHAGGGPKMLRAAVEAASANAAGPRLLAVTVLTSMDAEEIAAIGVEGAGPDQTGDQVRRLARMAVEEGISGLVASPLEASTLRSEFGPGLHLVTPGIRQAEASKAPMTKPDDQQRIATPYAAIRAGASRLVIGRPILKAADPAAAYQSILEEIRAATAPEAGSLTAFSTSNA